MQSIFASHGFSGTGQTDHWYSQFIKITSPLWSQVGFGLNFKITSCEISPVVDRVMSRHRKWCEEILLCRFLRGLYKITAANTGVFGTNCAAVNEKDSLQGTPRNSNKHRGWHSVTNSRQFHSSLRQLDFLQKIR